MLLIDNCLGVNVNTHVNSGGADVKQEVQVAQGHVVEDEEEEKKLRLNFSVGEGQEGLLQVDANFINEVYPSDLGVLEI